MHYIFTLGLDSTGIPLNIYSTVFNNRIITKLKDQLTL